MTLDTEANLQGEFYHQARIIGLQVVLELSCPLGRFDIAVFSADRSRFIAIVECKHGKAAFWNGHSPQIIRYKRTGLPVYGLCSVDRAQRLVSTIAAKHLLDQGIPIADIEKLPSARPSKKNLPSLSLREKYPDLAIRD